MFLTLEKRECSASLGCRSSCYISGIVNPGSLGKRQTLATLSQTAETSWCVAQGRVEGPHLLGGMLSRRSSRGLLHPDCFSP